MAFSVTSKGGIGGGKAHKLSVEGLKELEAKLRKLSGENPEVKIGIQRLCGQAAKEMRDEMSAKATAAGWASEKPLHVGVRTDVTQRKLRGKLGKLNIWVGERAVSAGPQFTSGTMTGGAALDSIFSYGKPRGFKGWKVDALAGVTKPETMVEWKAGKRPRSSRAKVPAGQKVAMAFATMLEFGTSRRKARPAIRIAVKSARSRIIAKIADGYRDLIRDWTNV